MVAGIPYIDGIAINREGTVYPSGAPEFTPGFVLFFSLLCNVLQIDVCPFVLFWPLLFLSFSD